MFMRVAVLGASGLVGSLLLDSLILEKEIDEIYVIHYRELKSIHAKVRVVVIDFSAFDQLMLDGTIDVAFCCLGTTKKKTPDLEKYFKIDVEYPFVFANWFKKQGGKHYSVVSAVSADASSSNYYSMFKGELEQRLESLQLPHLSIMQPSLLLGSRRESRLAEGIGKLFAPALNTLLLGRLKKYRAIAAHKVVNKMIEAVTGQVDRVSRYDWSDFSNF